MKNKIATILVVGIFVLSGLGAVAVTNEKIYSTLVEKSETRMLEFSEPILEEYNSEYYEIFVPETSNYYMSPGQPVVPKMIEAIELPFGVKNVRVEVTPKNVHEIEIGKEIRPGPAFLALTDVSPSVSIDSIKDMEVYSSEDPFPDAWYKTRIGCGANADGKIVTHVAIETYPARYAPALDKLIIADGFDIEILYDDPETNPFPLTTTYDMVIIAPPKFSSDLQKLINHKNNLNPPVRTYLKTTDDIYDEYSGMDKPEKIKYFIKDAIETEGIKYVLLVGGLKSLIWGKPRDDLNQGSKDWLVPVRYTNLWDNPKYPLEDEIVRDKGVISDLYYADIYREGGEFENWDPNGDGIILAWDCQDGLIENDTGIDFYADIAVGRLACRNVYEVRAMVDKIINYENNAFGSDWFEKMTVITGDGFLDQQDLDVQWDINELDDGAYTIYAQSNNPDMDMSLIDETHITIDRTKETVITFNHDDYLTYEIGVPMAKITSLSDGDNLGYDDYFREPEENEAYCNEFLGWATLNYTDGVMHIRGKCYDPSPYGDTTDIRVWIENSDEEIVLDQTIENTKMYYEGEWVTGERLLKGGGGALYYMPEEFDSQLLWTSNGKWTGQQDVIDEFSTGSGFVFFSGHGAPQTWGDHVAGIPGNRKHASIDGLYILHFPEPPFFPMNKLSNNYKTPVVLVGGCHNSQFNVSFLATILNLPNMWTYGAPAPECWSWWLTRLSKRGSLGTIGNTGLGYGVIGDDCNVVGLDGGICIEFFKQYGAGNIFLGDAYMQTQVHYVEDFDMTLQEHGKSLTQWVLMGDPSLKIGGYEDAQQPISIVIDNNGVTTDADGIPNCPLDFEASASGQPTYYWDFDDDGDFDDAVGENIEFTWTTPGVYWVGVKADFGSYDEITYTVVDIEMDEFPSLPTTPAGPSVVKKDRLYSFTTKSTDPYDEDLYYIIDWGDGEMGWVGPKTSGEEVRIWHIWKEKGDYEVKVMAVNEMAYWSQWSDPLHITVIKDRARINQPVMQLLQKFFENYPNAFPLLRQLLRV